MSCRCLFLSVTVGAYVCTSLRFTEARGLLGHWRFNEGNGEIVSDSSGHENDGEVWDARWMKGKFGAVGFWLYGDGNGQSFELQRPPGLQGLSQARRVGTDNANRVSFSLPRPRPDAFGVIVSLTEAYP